MSDRKLFIRDIILDLQELEKQGFSNSYAVKENIKFFESAKNIFSYAAWLFLCAPFIERERLLELSDFPFSRWDEDLHAKLNRIERRAFPDLLRPLRRALVHHISHRKISIVMDLGSGAMEIERHVILELLKKKYHHKFVIIGLDRSVAAHRRARRNLKSLEGYIDIVEVENLDYQRLQSFIENIGNKHLIILCKNDIFKLENFFPRQSIDLIYYSKFRHHLTEDQKLSLDSITIKLAASVMEYDDYKSWPLLIPQSITAWKYPVLLNGAIFSRLRDPSKKELKKISREWRVQFYGIGSYLKTHQN